MACDLCLHACSVDGGTGGVPSLCRCGVKHVFLVSLPAGETREKKDLVYVDADGVMKVRMALLSLAESHALFRSPGHALCTRQHLKLCAPICALHLQSSKPVDEKLVERRKEGVHPGKVRA